MFTFKLLNTLMPLFDVLPALSDSAWFSVIACNASSDILQSVNLASHLLSLCHSPRLLTVSFCTVRVYNLHSVLFPGYSFVLVVALQLDIVTMDDPELR